MSDKCVARTLGLHGHARVEAHGACDENANSHDQLGSVESGFWWSTAARVRSWSRCLVSICWVR